MRSPTLVIRRCSPPESGLYRKAVGMHIGQWIAFSGNFLANPTDCVRESSLTMDGSFRALPVRIFVDPDFDLLLTANTNAGTTLRQVAFDKSVQRRLGSSILLDRIKRYREERGLNTDFEDFSEKEL